MALPQTPDQTLAFILGNDLPIVDDGSARRTRLWCEVLIFYIVNILDDVPTPSLGRTLLALEYPCHGVVAGNKVFQTENISTLESGK